MLPGAHRWSSASSVARMSARDQHRFALISAGILLDRQLRSVIELDNQLVNKAPANRSALTRATAP
jgi:hypothetical protein